MLTQAHIYFCGTVQGVGFRFTCRRIAASLGLSGWVRNLKDGRVEALAEGEEEEIVWLITKLRERFDGYLREVQTNYHKATGEFQGFDIR